MGSYVFHYWDKLLSWSQFWYIAQYHNKAFSDIDPSAMLHICELSDFAFPSKLKGLQCWHNQTIPDKTLPLQYRHSEYS